MTRTEQRRHDLAEHRTLAEVADTLGVSRQAVSNVERRAIRRIWQQQVRRLPPERRP